MSAPEFTGDVQHDLEELRASHPGCQIVHTAGRWWAARGPVLSERQIAADAVQAVTAEALHGRLTARPERRR